MMLCLDDNLKTDPRQVKSLTSKKLSASYVKKERKTDVS